MSNLPGATGHERLELDEQTRYVLRDIFKSKDTDDTGYFDADQLADCLEVIGYNAHSEDLEFLLQYFDNNGNGKICIDEIMDNLHIIQAHSLHKDEIIASFKMFDLNGDGYIRYPELLKILTAKGPDQMPVERARKLVDYLARNYDRNGDGKFSYPEFVEIFMNKDAILKNVPATKKAPAVQTSID